MADTLTQGADTPAPDAVPSTAPADAGKTPQAPTPPKAPNDKELAKRFKARAETSKRHTETLRGEWQRNVATRLGRQAAQYTGGLGGEVVDQLTQSEINPDWSLTKTKTANLFSQVPTVRLIHERRDYQAALPPFQKALNYELGEKRADIGTAMEEALNDAVNAAGVGAVLVGYEARFGTQSVPAIDTSLIPPQQLQAMQAANLLPMRQVDVLLDYKFFGVRVSPADLLWPAEFTGSNFDDGDWVGRRGRMPWASAAHEFKLNETDKEAVVKGGTREKSLRDDDESEDADVETVHFTEIFYWRARVDPTETSLNCIFRLVFVDGKDEPAVHGPWLGQQRDEQTGKYVGCCRFPLRLLTLTYVSDHPVPPSDTAAGRPQVTDLRTSRSQLFANRERSMPIRWFDTNRVDPLIQDLLMRGKFQGFLPTQGDGSRAIGEVARASYPAEDFAFDRTTKSDLMETWQLGPNQMGTISSGEKPTKGEVQTTQANFATRIGQERNRTARFFLGIAETMAGLMALYSDFPMLTPEEVQAMQQAWDRKHILQDLVFSIRPDSTIVLESGDRMNRLANLLNLTVKSGFVNPQPIIREMVMLTGLDPDEVMVQPKPQGPPPPNISLRLDQDSLSNAIVVAMLMKDGVMPEPQIIAAARQLLTSLQPHNAPTPPPPGAGGPVPPSGPLPPGEVAHPEWTQGSTLIKRQEQGE